MYWKKGCRAVPALSAAWVLSMGAVQSAAENDYMCTAVCHGVFAGLILV